MNTFRQNFRQWWQPPRKANEQPEERTVSFLELFYDLVYVIIIAELAHALAGHVTLTDMAAFAFLFAIVWWAWLNGTFYHDLHGNNDIRTRVFTFLQMFTVGAMAVFAHNALGDGSRGFALSYAAFHLILTFLWWRTGVHDPSHRPLSQPYTLIFLTTTVLFVVSAFVPAPLRFYLWGASLFMDIVLSLLNVVRVNKVAPEDSVLALSVSASLIERFGLFIIIVLGEVIVGVVGGVAEHPHISWTVATIAALGMAIAFGLWWLFFDFVSNHAPRPQQLASFSWMFLHLPVAIGISATGAAILNVVEHAGEPVANEVRWLLVGAISVVLICITLLMRILDVAPALRRIYRNRTGSWIMLAASIVVLLLGFIPIGTIPLLFLLITLLLVPIFYGIFVWISVFAGQDVQAEHFSHNE